VLDSTIRPSDRHDIGRLLAVCPRLTLHAGDVRSADDFSEAALLFGTVVSGGVRVKLPLTHELLGQAVGSARETVTSALRTLEREEFLVREGRLYRLMISPEILDSDTHSPATREKGHV
jgi:CRP-like cAMP-binding protein